LVIKVWSIGVWCWRVNCQGADDDSDVIVTLPDELGSALGWTVGDTLNLEPAIDGTLVFSKKW